ncbi:MAG: hypothetical protein WCA49_17215 [Candidatus Sulfotelmatobacter sp.]
MSDTQQYEELSLATTLMHLEDRNARAQEIIQSYSRLHAGMDVAVGLAGLLPGAAIPALIAAIAAQSPIIYQPMARDLAAVYTVDEDYISQNIEQVRGVLKNAALQTGFLDVASEFGTEFIMQIGGELLTEAGLGIMASLCVPVLGGAIGAALDYLIANMMTWRVGIMVSIYYQNGGDWLSSRHETFEEAKRMTGGIATSVGEVLDAKKRERNVRVDLNSLRTKIPQIAELQVRSVKGIIDMMRDAMSNDQIRAALLGKGIPVDIIEKALSLSARVVTLASH